MRKLILLLPLLLLFLTLPSFAENKYDIHPVKKIEANPINVAVSLTERPDAATMASTCEYYGYVNQPTQDGYTVFKHPSGAVIRYMFTMEEDGKSYPTVEVKSKGNMKEMVKILEDLNFKKNGNHYERKSIEHITRTSAGTQGFLCISNRPKSKK